MISNERDVHALQGVLAAARETADRLEETERVQRHSKLGALAEVTLRKWKVLQANMGHVRRMMKDERPSSPTDSEGGA